MNQRRFLPHDGTCPPCIFDPTQTLEHGHPCTQDVLNILYQRTMNQALLIHGLLSPPVDKRLKPLTVSHTTSRAQWMKPCLTTLKSHRSGSFSTAESNTESMHSVSSTPTVLKSCLKVASQTESLRLAYPTSLATSASQESVEKKTISFGTVQVDWHERMLGDNPAVR